MYMLFGCTTARLELNYYYYYSTFQQNSRQTWIFFCKVTVSHQRRLFL